jgi:hypothetical protein
LPNANHSEAATKNNNSVALRVSEIVMDCIQYTLLSITWRASLVPAAAVIPAPRAYINVVAVKKPVVGFENIVRVCAPRVGSSGSWDCGNTLRRCSTQMRDWLSVQFSSLRKGHPRISHTPKDTPADVTVSKTECSRQPTVFG